jgi:L-ornithine N5-oxygenase
VEVGDDRDAVRVGRDHRVEMAPEATPGRYLQGGTEHTHGLISTLLSTVAVRTDEIHCSVPAGRTAD